MHSSFKDITQLKSFKALPDSVSHLVAHPFTAGDVLSKSRHDGGTSTQQYAHLTAYQFHVTFYLFN